MPVHSFHGSGWDWKNSTGFYTFLSDHTTTLICSRRSACEHSISQKFLLPKLKRIMKYVNKANWLQNLSLRYIFLC